MDRRILLDTNILLNHFEEILTLYSDVGIIIPLICLEEIDNQKSRINEDVGYKAREVVRKLFEIKQYGRLNDWIKLENNISIHVEHNFDDSLNLNYKSNDDIILGTLSYSIKKYGKTIFYTNDINLTLKAEALGFETKQLSIIEKSGYNGHIEVEVEDYLIDNFYKNGHINSNLIFDSDLYENMCITLVSKNNPKKQALTIYNDSKLNKLKYGQDGIFGGTKGKNRQQKYLLNLLMDDNIKIVAVDSPAGTGKSYLSAICGLQKVLEDSIYKRILYIKPLEPMGGKEIGFLPNSKNDKLLGGYAGTLSNILENVFSQREKQYSKLSYAEDLIEKGYLQVEAPTFMRGMSYADTFMIIDESSNISKTDIKNLITRAGDNTKVVIIGDGVQLDNPKTSHLNNGLRHTIEALKGSSLFATIELDKSVRSEVAQLCVDKL